MSYSDDDPTITAHTFLRTYLDMRSLTPRLEEWTEAEQSRNPPRLIRLRRLHAMFQAFGIAWDLQGFAEGAFIDPLEPRYAALIDRYAPKQIPGNPGIRRIPGLPGVPAMPPDRGAPNDLDLFFSMLLEFRYKVQRVLDDPGRYFTTTGTTRRAHEIMTTVAADLRTSVHPVDDALAALISPEAATFDIEEMRDQYGYPDVDLWMIDADWT